MATSDVRAASLLSSARGYQLEMLNESLRSNIVVALDTGSGKTLIAFDEHFLPPKAHISTSFIQYIAHQTFS
jgi:hypothetical protein